MSLIYSVYLKKIPTKQSKMFEQRTAKLIYMDFKAFNQEFAAAYRELVRAMGLINTLPVPRCTLASPSQFAAEPIRGLTVNCKDAAHATA